MLAFCYLRKNKLLALVNGGIDKRSQIVNRAVPSLAILFPRFQCHRIVVAEFNTFGQVAADFR
jgi:hypothetical protein